MPTFETLCTDLIVKARQPLTIPVNYNLYDYDYRAPSKRLLELDPTPYYEAIAKSKWQLKPFERSQSGLSIWQFFPDATTGVCACGCGQQLPKRRTRWASADCSRFALNVYWIVYGRAWNIDCHLQAIAGGIHNCMLCGEYKPGSKFENDHIVPVQCGGGGCWISNYQRLCITCHKEKTKADNELRRQLIKTALRSNSGPDLFS